jgi:hypothetical protein
MNIAGENTLPKAFDSFSERLTRVTLGIDALERRRNRGDGPLDSEGLVPIYLGNDLVAAPAYTDWADAESELGVLEKQLPQVAPASRRVFATAMLRSLRASLHLFRGGTLDYAAKVSDLVGAPAGPVDAQEVEGARERLDVLLRACGVVRGNLAHRIAVWEEQRALSPGELESTFHTLMAQGRSRTAARIFDTGNFTMTLNPVRGVPYTARCGFDAGKMDLNVDIKFTRAAIKHLVAHEVFPGHATQLLLTRARVEQGTAHPETLLCTANTVLGCVQEGIADEGVSLIDWFEDDDDHIHLELRRLRSAAQTSAAWYLMVDGRPAESVAQYLRDTAAGQESWVQGRLKMAAHPFRGAFIASYWAGARAVRRVFERTAPADFTRFVDYLYGNAHSPQSLEMFS